MTIDDSIRALRIAEEQFEAEPPTPFTFARLRYLTRTLTERPDEFWTEYFELADPQRIADSLKLLDEIGGHATHRDLRFLAELEDRRIRLADQQ